MVAVKEPPKSYLNKAISVASRCEADFAADVARTLTRPQVTNAGIIENWQKDTHDVNALAAELGKQVEAVNGVCGLANGLPGLRVDSLKTASYGKPFPSGPASTGNISRIPLFALCGE